MKFISKSSNLLIVLRAGLSAQPITGTPAKSTVSVLFRDGVAEVTDKELVDMMLAHPGFNGDFISAEGVAIDPYAVTRQSSEPAHVMTEMKFGTPINRSIQGGATAQLPPELQKIVQEASLVIAKNMLPGMLQEALKSLVKGHEAEKAIKTKGKPGRKPFKKVEIKDSVVTENPLIKESVA